MKRALILAAGLVVGVGQVWADAIIFTNGDRISGQIVATGTKRIKIKTPYGRLEVPRTEIERLSWSDGREEILNAPPEPRTSADLVILVSGHTFWQAWDTELTPADPSLRLAVTLGDQEIVTYTDVNLDPQDLKGALVNSFVFSPERLFVGPADGVTAEPPELRGNQIHLALEVPEALTGPQLLGLAYQLNGGTSAAPDWYDVVVAGTAVELAAETPVSVRVEQDRGVMEFKKGAMHRVETFRAVARVVPIAP